MIPPCGPCCGDGPCECCANYDTAFEAGYYAVWTLLVSYDFGDPVTYTMTKRDGECVWESEDGLVRILEPSGPGNGGGAGGGYNIFFYADAEDDDGDWIGATWADYPTFGADDQWCREEGNDNPTTELGSGAIGATVFAIVSLTPSTGTWVSCDGA